MTDNRTVKFAEANEYEIRAMIQSPLSLPR